MEREFVTKIFRNGTLCAVVYSHTFDGAIFAAQEYATKGKAYTVSVKSR